MCILPRHIQITVMRGNEIYTSVVAINERPVNYDVNTRLSRLSWDMADGRTGFDEAQNSFRRNNKG